MGLFTKNSQNQNRHFEDPTAGYIMKESKNVISSSNSSGFRPSDVYDPSLHGNGGIGYKSQRDEYVPTAKEAAFSGPPRYDWVDVESAAAIKIQSIVRRNQVLAQLEKEGKSTAAMRNKIRARQAKGKKFIGEDVPFFAKFCGIGLLFSDVTGEDTNALNEGLNKVEMKEKEEKVRRRFKMKKKSVDMMEEAIEVVDDVNDSNVKAQLKKKKRGFFGRNKSEV
jgi:hypothetical protein